MFGLARNRMSMRFRKNIEVCSHDLPFCVAIYCVVVGRRSHNESLMKAKRVLKKEMS